MRNKVAKHLTKLTNMREVREILGVKAGESTGDRNIEKAMKTAWNRLTKAERAKRRKTAGL